MCENVEVNDIYGDIDAHSSANQETTATLARSYVPMDKNTPALNVFEAVEAEKKNDLQIVRKTR